MPLVGGVRVRYPRLAMLAVLHSLDSTEASLGEARNPNHCYAKLTDLDGTDSLSSTQPNVKPNDQQNYIEVTPSAPSLPSLDFWGDKLASVTSGLLSKDPTGRQQAWAEAPHILDAILSHSMRQNAAGGDDGFVVSGGGSGGRGGGGGGGRGGEGAPPSCSEVDYCFHVKV